MFCQSKCLSASCCTRSMFLHGLAEIPVGQTTGAEYLGNVYGCTNEVAGTTPTTKTGGFISHMSAARFVNTFFCQHFRRFWRNCNCLPSASQFYLFIIFTYFVISAAECRYSNTSSPGTEANTFVVICETLHSLSLSLVCVCGGGGGGAPYSYFVQHLT